MEQTKDLIIAHAGLELFGEFAIGLGLVEALEKSLPGPGSGAGYRASEHVLPLMLMLNGGGRSLEDLRELPKGKRIKALRADSAAYQASVINYCQGHGIEFGIGADLDKAVVRAIEAIGGQDCFSWAQYLVESPPACARPFC